MVDEKNTQKESIKVLQECAELQIKKSQDYNNPDSRVRQEMYYTRGVATLLDIMWGKMLRMYSVVEAMENDIDYNPNFESLEDSAKDMINYSSFVVAYLRNGIDGQDGSKDFLGRRIKHETKDG
jgi:hypothetical protein